MSATLHHWSTSRQFKSKMFLKCTPFNDIKLNRISPPLHWVDRPFFQVEIEGLTGEIRFSEEGKRQNYTLHVVEMTVNSAMVKVAEWSDETGFTPVAVKYSRWNSKRFEKNKMYIVTTIVVRFLLLRDCLYAHSQQKLIASPMMFMWNKWRILSQHSIPHKCQLSNCWRFRLHYSKTRWNPQNQWNVKELVFTSITFLSSFGGTLTKLASTEAKKINWFETYMTKGIERKRETTRQVQYWKSKATETANAQYCSRKRYKE